MKLCVDLGSTQVKSALVENYEISKKVTLPVDTKNGIDGVISSLKNAIDKLIGDSVTEICVSVAGRINRATGKVLYATENLPENTEFDVGEWVKANYNLPCAVLYDGHAALLGEIVQNKEYESLRVIMLTLGAKVDGAYAVNGKIIADESNGYAELGHTVIYEGGIMCNCGNKGCAEQYLSERAINRAAACLGIDKDAVFNEYASGSTGARTAVRSLRGHLSRCLLKIGEKCPFDVCILSGSVADGMGDHFNEITGGLGYDIRKASAGNNAGLLGAYSFADKQKM